MCANDESFFVVITMTNRQLLNDNLTNETHVPWCRLYVILTNARTKLSWSPQKNLNNHHYDTENETMSPNERQNVHVKVRLVRNNLGKHICWTIITAKLIVYFQGEFPPSIYAYNPPNKSFLLKWLFERCQSEYEVTVASRRANKFQVIFRLVLWKMYFLLCFMSELRNL